MIYENEMCDLTPYNTYHQPKVTITDNEMRNRPNCLTTDHTV